MTDQPTCRHTEHAIRAPYGVMGRYFEGLNDIAGKWEPCPVENGDEEEDQP